jgi:hypothetical protein
MPCTVRPIPVRSVRSDPIFETNTQPPGKLMLVISKVGGRALPRRKVTEGNLKSQVAGSVIGVYFASTFLSCSRARATGLCDHAHRFEYDHLDLHFQRRNPSVWRGSDL